MLNVKLFIAKVRKMLFVERVDWEIFHRIFRQIDQQADYGYGFGNEQEINAQNDAMLRKLCNQIAEIEQLTNRMPKSYAMGLRNIVYRDMSARMQKYLTLARQRTPRTERTAGSAVVPVKATA